MTKSVRIVDWAGNVKYHGQTFPSETAAWDFLTEDQHQRHPNATEKEFDEILGEFELETIGE